MATKKKAKQIEDLKTIEDVREFRKSVIAPMDPGEERHKLLIALRAKRKEIMGIK